MPKKFELALDKGPYIHDYSRNGRYLLIGGQKGHLSMLDWQKCELKTEMNIDDKVNAISFLFDESMFAVAQRKHTYIYDSDGVEIHCLKKHISPLGLCFLPYHFLLCSANRKGHLVYTDVSTGDHISYLHSRLGACKVITSNPSNGVIHLGHLNGMVTLWTPKSTNSLVKIRCHNGPITSINFDQSGKYMVTSATDNKINIWDMRQYKKISSYYKQVSRTGTVAVSQKGVLAVAQGPRVSLWRQPFKQAMKSPDIKHLAPGRQYNCAKFCPYEDALGLSRVDGFTSLQVAGSGEPDFDSLEVNPFESRHEKRERLVRGLIEKVQPDLITLNPDHIGSVWDAKKPVLDHLEVVKKNNNVFERKEKIERNFGEVGKTKNRYFN